jgi:hypothetical protein
MTSTLSPVNNPLPECRCFKPPLLHSDFSSEYLGVDATNGRFADVSIETCIHCGRRWLKYAVEFEAFSRSGRWYRGVVTDQELKGMTPGKAVACLEGLDWFIFGGSYFSSSGMFGKGKLQVDW